MRLCGFPFLFPLSTNAQQQLNNDILCKNKSL